jgi:hypothetical protein
MGSRCIDLCISDSGPAPLQEGKYVLVSLGQMKAWWMPERVWMTKNMGRYNFNYKSCKENTSWDLSGRYNSWHLYFSVTAKILIIK